AGVGCKCVAGSPRARRQGGRRHSRRARTGRAVSPSLPWYGRRNRLRGAAAWRVALRIAATESQSRQGRRHYPTGAVALGWLRIATDTEMDPTRAAKERRTSSPNAEAVAVAR